MADPATIAAIIGAITAAASTAATVTQSEVNREGSGIAATVLNESDFDFTISSFDLNHGDWMDHPSVAVNSVKTIYDMLRKEAELVAKTPQTDEQINTYWQTKYVAPGTAKVFVRSAFTSYEMKGAGMGSEGLVRLTSKAPGCPAIFLLIRKIPGGSYGAGVGIYGGPDFDSWVLDNYGTKILNLIKAAPDVPPTSAEGTQFSEGTTKTANNGPVKVTFAGAQSTEFLIQNA
jgi:hypothetical protein